MAENGYAQMLAEKRANVHSNMTEILDKATAEKRELTVDEQTTYDRMNGELDGLRGTIDSMLKADADNAAVEESLRKLSEKRQEIDAPPKADPAGDALRSFLKGETRSLDIVGNVPERRANTAGTNTGGGYTVPTDFYGKLWAHMILTANLINAGATVINTSSGEAIQFPTTTAHPTAVLVTETSALTESDAAFTQRTLGAYKYGVLLQASKELLTDTGVDLEGYLAMAAGRAVGNAFGTDIVTGTGGGVKPTGILQSTTLGKTGGTGVVGAPTFDDLIDLYHSVISPYRNSPATAWVMNDITAGGVRKLKTSQGVYLWQPSVVLGEPDVILGKPVYTDPNVPAAALNAKSVVFGDLAAYLVRTVQSIRFEQSLDFAFSTDLITFRCIFRGDGVLLDQTGAVKHFAGGAS